MNDKVQKEHRFDMTDRKRAAITAVTKVESATPAELVLYTALGKMEIKGSELKIEKFDAESGDLRLTGNIDAVRYAAEKVSLVKRIFK